MKTIKILFLILSPLIFASGCNEGCTDSDAVSYDISADKDDGTCNYSQLSFYGSVFSPCPPVVVEVNGSSIGTINAAYPSGPGNCSAPGLAHFTFSNGDPVDWIAQDQCGFIFSGTVRPRSNAECIHVRVY